MTLKQIEQLGFKTLEKTTGFFNQYILPLTRQKLK